MRAVALSKPAAIKAIGLISLNESTDWEWLKQSDVVLLKHSEFVLSEAEQHTAGQESSGSSI